MPLRESAALRARESTNYLRIPGPEGLGPTEATSRAEYQTQGVAVAQVLRSTFRRPGSLRSRVLHQPVRLPPKRRGP